MSAKIVTTNILSALVEEQQRLIEQLQNLRCTERAGRESWMDGLHGHPVVLALPKIGKVAAVITTTLLEVFGVSPIVSTDASGGLGDGVRVGEVAVASGFVQDDMDGSHLFPRDQIPHYGRNLFACDSILSHTLWKAFIQYRRGLETFFFQKCGADYRLSGIDSQRRQLRQRRRQRQHRQGRNVEM